MVVVPKQRKITCAVIGDGMVGKTSFIKSFLGEKFNRNYVATTSDIYSGLPIFDGERYNMEIFDFAGEWDPEILSTSGFQKSQVIILCFNIGDRDSLDSIQSFWAPQLKQLKRKPRVILVGLQSEQGHKRRNSTNCVTEEDGLLVQHEIKADSYYECSALRGSNVRSVFSNVVEIAVECSKKRLSFIKKAFKR